MPLNNNEQIMQKSHLIPCDSMKTLHKLIKNLILQN